MPKKIKHILRRLHPIKITNQLHIFLKDESISGKLILGATLLSLIVVNSPLLETYSRFWHLTFSLGLGNWSLSLDLRHWVNEGLMAFFFLIVGLEIKRELVKGELRNIKTALLPIGAAVGGMVLPAVIYLVFNLHGEGVRGWGIPIATDIAFAVAILTLLGKRVPVSLKVFLLTLAIADDIGAITIIALFYAEIIHFGFLCASVVIVIALTVLRKYLTNKLLLVVLAGIVLWITTHLSGVHASIAGAVMGLLAPIYKEQHRISVAERIERFFLPITTFIVLPLFAFANAGFIISSVAIKEHSSVALGTVLGLVLGKAIGVLATSWVLVRLGIASLPSNTRWGHILGVGLVAGIGFTVSIFITELAFAGNSELIDAAKISIFVASAISAILGSLVLWKTPAKLEPK